jgi:homogentisate 1,2-dioxygenase
MPQYLSRGDIPRKRHTQFRGPDGALHYEEHVSRKGFSGVYSNLYHLRMPTRVARVGQMRPVQLQGAAMEHKPRHFRTAKLESAGDPVGGRVALVFNSDMILSKAHITREAEGFYRNGAFDELCYVQQGSGELHTQLGSLPFSAGDYLVVPRGVTQRISLREPLRLLILETRGPVETPARFRNEYGQLLESAPFCERDIRAPDLGDPAHDAGEQLLTVRTAEGYQDYVLAGHPFDVVGWDGCYYPWAFSIHDFEPVTGSLHLPPPVHQTFQAPGLVVCSFVTRQFDYHPLSIPAPYPHSNVDSDELIFYSWGDFMSRKGIEAESITLHPMGLPHGPQPGKYEDSIGKKGTEELAVMIDTFAPVKVAQGALGVDDSGYALSWL